MGEYSKVSGLGLNSSGVLGYDPSLHAHRLSKFVSKCLVKNCYGNQGALQTSKLTTPANFVIGGLFSIHQHDSNFFKCGKFNDDRIFQNLLALTFAVNNINSNASLLPDLKIGMMLVDYCDRPERAQKELFTYFDRETGKASSNLIGAIAFDPKVATAVSPILEANHILQVINPISTMERSGEKLQSMHLLVPNTHGALLAAAEVLDAYRWRYVNVIHSKNPSGRQKRDVFLNAANDKGICVTRNFETAEDMSQESLKKLVTKLLQSRRQGQVFVLMVDSSNEAKMILESVRRTGLSSKIMWILVGKWANEKVLERLGNIVQGSFIINMDSYNIPEFQEYYSSLTLDHHYPIPDDWFEEFWQNTFQCRLPYSTVSAEETAQECTGSESLRNIRFEQDDHVFHTVDVVQTIARTLHGFLKEKCKWNGHYETIDDCKGTGSKDLQRVLLGAIADDKTSGRGYAILNSQLVKTGRYHFKTVSCV